MSEISVTSKRKTDLFLPSLIQLFVTAGVFAAFYAVKSISGKLICNVADVAGEKTDPSLGRLICCLTFFAVSMILVTLSSRIWKTSSEKILSTFTLSILGGTFLWTSVGECSWHFGFNILTDEGKDAFASFPRIESIQGLPFFILCVLIFAACFRKMAFPLAAYILTFLGNWYGHLCMIAAYPIAVALGSDMELPVFYKASALVNAGVIAAVGLSLIAGKTKRTTKYLAAVCIYVALGNVLFGCVMGET